MLSYVEALSLHQCIVKIESQLDLFEVGQTFTEVHESIQIEYFIESDGRVEISSAQVCDREKRTLKLELQEYFDKVFYNQ